MGRAARELDKVGAAAVAGAWVALASAMLPLQAEADVFAEESPLAIKLTAPFNAVFRAREAEDREYQEGTLAYGEGSDGKTLPVRVRVRGKSRAVACSFPPLLLNFRTPDLAESILEGEDRLKLVTHCQASDAYDNYVVLEYLTYRVYNLLTPISLRARRVDVSYFDSERQRDLGTRPGILLEDEERFAERHGYTMFEEGTVERSRYDADALALLDVFQYFIGNTDVSAIAGPQGEICCHNVVPYLRSDDTPDDASDNEMVPVPYDFDAAGIVDAPHAAPDERLPIKDVRQRLYRGRCRSPEELAPVFSLFEQQRAAITALFDESQGLDAKSAEKARGYVDDFYEVLGDEKRRENAFFAVCKR
jgi:hypothetical protein